MYVVPRRVCLGPWKEHGSNYYNCNKFKEGTAKGTQSVEQKAKVRSKQCKSAAFCLVEQRAKVQSMYKVTNSSAAAASSAFLR